MNKFIVHFIVCWFGLIAFADTHIELVYQLRTNLKGQGSILYRQVQDLRLALKQYDVQSQELDAAESILVDMAESPAWKALESRTTRVREKAEQDLTSFIVNAKSKIAVAEKRLELEKQLVYEQWARENPEEARMVELEKRIERAERLSRVALGRAEEAEYAAQRAESEAERARIAAENEFTEREKRKHQSEELDRRARETMRF